MKRNIILYIIIGLIIVFIGFITFAKFRNANDSKKPTINTELNNDNSKNSKLDLTSETLYEYGKKIYDEKTYTKYSMNESGVYVITYGDLIKEGYTLSFLGENCLDESEILKIDADFKLYPTYYDNYPILYTPGCLTPELKKEIELKKQNAVETEVIE